MQPTTIRIVSRLPEAGLEVGLDELSLAKRMRNTTVRMSSRLSRLASKRASMNYSLSNVLRIHDSLKYLNFIVASLDKGLADQSIGNPILYNTFYVIEALGDSGFYNSKR